MKFPEIRKEVLARTVELYKAGLFTVTSGNLSMLDEESGLIVITPSSYPYMLMKEEDLVVITKDGEKIEGDLRPSSEWKLHAAIYKARPEISGVVHTHSPYAISLAVKREPLPLILAEMQYAFGGSVPVAPFARPGSPEVGSGAVEALGEKKTAALMANHGVVTIGETLSKAVDRAYYVEDAAKVYTYVLSTGGTPTYFE